MKIQNVGNISPNFNGKVYIAQKSLTLAEMSRLEKGTERYITYAKNKPLDFVIIKDAIKHRLNVIARKVSETTDINTKAQSFLNGEKVDLYEEIIEYPTGNVVKDINLVLKAMERITSRYEKPSYHADWSGE